MASVIVHDKGWNAIKAELAKAATLEVAVGVLATAGGSAGFSIAEYAAANEYGTDTIPARPFMAISFDENKAEIEQDFKRQGSALASGRQSAVGALTVVGQKHAERISRTITGRDILPALAPATVAGKKGSHKTLVDTGALANAIHISIRGGK